MLGVARARFTTPLGDVISTEVLPVTKPAPLIPPEVVVCSVMVVPVSAAPTVMALAALESINESGAPAALIAAVNAMAPPLSVRLNPPVPMVDAPFPVIAVESVKVTLPATPPV